MNLIYVTFFILLITTVESAKILGIFNFPSKSHHILGDALLRALAANGHDVTMLSPFKSKNLPKNYNQLIIPEINTYKNEHMDNMILNLSNHSLFTQIALMMQHTSAMETILFEHQIVTELIKSNRKFDVAIVEWFGNDAIIALSHHIANATIVLSTIGSNYMLDKLTLVPTPYSYVPNLMPPYPDEMNFLERLGNTLHGTFGKVFMLFLTYQQRFVIDKYIPNAPSSYDLHQHVSLVLINTHYSIESPRPYVPNMIQIGGFHLEEATELTADLKQLMDHAKEGVIFFSLGSNVRSADIPEDKIQSILATFAKLPYRVLWKFEENTLSLPENVNISSWFPQKNVLAHKNLKLFITHGGLLSTMESLYYGVPMIGIPIFADQSANVLDGSAKGYIFHIPFPELNEETFENAILEVMNNKRYRQNVEKRSRIFKDQQTKPIDRAVYWVEYVLRHEGAHHLKTSAFKLTWYEHNLLDVSAVIIITLMLFTFITCKLIKCVSRVLCKRAKSTKKLKAKTS